MDDLGYAHVPLSLRDLGFCWDACDAGADEPGCREGQTCVEGFMLDYFEPGDSPDFCLDIDVVEAGEPCSGALDVPCGSDRRCLDIDLSGPICREVCRYGEGAAGTTNHPDCSNPDATCPRLEEQWGICAL